MSSLYRVRLDVGTSFSRGHYTKVVPAEDGEHAEAKVRAMAIREHLAVHGAESVELVDGDDE